jgi:hypothetical protein
MSQKPAADLPTIQRCRLYRERDALTIHMCNAPVHLYRILNIDGHTLLLIERRFIDDANVNIYIAETKKVSIAQMTSKHIVHKVVTSR